MPSYDSPQSPWKGGAPTRPPDVDIGLYFPGRRPFQRLDRACCTSDPILAIWYNAGKRALVLREGGFEELFTTGSPPSRRLKCRDPQLCSDGRRLPRGVASAAGVGNLGSVDESFETVAGPPGIQVDVVNLGSHLQPLPRPSARPESWRSRSFTVGLFEQTDHLLSWSKSWKRSPNWDSKPSRFWPSS